MRHIGLLRCGHWFSEDWPGILPAPDNGELRACGYVEHYPMKYPTIYITDQKSIDEFLGWNAPPPAFRWESVFRKWLDSQNIDPRGRDELIDALRSSWRAALMSIATDRPAGLIEYFAPRTSKDNR